MSTKRATCAAARTATLAAVLGLCTSGCEGSLDIEWPIVLAIGAVIWLALAWHSLRRVPARMRYSRVDAWSALPATPRILAQRSLRGLRLLALALLIVACARPQLEEFDRRAVEGIDMFLLLDMSGSMRAVDLTPAEAAEVQGATGRRPLSRFEHAIATLKRVVAGRERDRIGMVVFARDAFLQFPLTLDYGTIQTLLDRLRLDAIDSSATAIGNAIGLGVRGLMSSEANSRAMILITDGKQQGGNISPLRAAEIAQEEGILLYTILVGREGPALVPTNFRNGDGSIRYRQEDYPVDPDLLAQMAEATGGAFYRAEEPEELERDLNDILDRLERSQMNDVSSVLEQELYDRFVALALLLFALEALLRFAYVRRLP